MSAALTRLLLLLIFSLAWAGAASAQTLSPPPGVPSNSPTFTGTVNGAIAIWSGNDTAAAFIPSGASCPTNGINLPAANTIGICSQSLQAFRVWAQTPQAGQFEILGGLNTVSTPTTMWEINRSAAASPPIMGGAMIRLIGNDAAEPGIMYNSWGRKGFIAFERGNGTNASTTTLVSGDVIGMLGWTGYNGTGYLPQVGVSQLAAQIIGEANETWGANNNGSNMYFQVTNTGANTVTTLLKLFGTTATSNGQAGQIAVGTGNIAAPCIAGPVVLISGNATCPPANSTAAATMLQISGADAVATRLSMQSFAGANFINFQRANTSNASPSTLASGDQIGGFQWAAYNSSAYTVQKATFDVTAAEAWTTGANGTNMRFFTTAAGGTTQNQKMMLWSAGGLSVGNANIGNDPGAGGVQATIAVLAGTTDATSTTTGTLTIAGGVSLRKRLWADGLSTTTASQSAYVCQASTGELVADTSVTNLCVASSRAFKRDIVSLSDDSGLAEVMKLRPVSFKYNPEGRFSNDKTLVGLIAEEVAEVDPRIVGYVADRPHSVQYEFLTAILVKAIQEQQRQIDELKASR